MNAQENGVTLRELTSVAELKQAESFQREVWGEDDPPDNSDIMLAIQHEGGLVAGAFKDGRMLGFLFGFPTSDPTIQHSHRLAVHPDSRGMGLGVKLKWYQRDWCLARGITMARWTYDPLRRINAGLNIARLGAIARRYHEDYYGEMVGINAGVPSDRLLAEWHLDTAEIAQRAVDPQAPAPQPDNIVARVAIPADFPALLANDLETALAERLRVRSELVTAFAGGLIVAGFDTARGEYLLCHSRMSDL
ncbi:GNAT family N-acetyltransferase [Sulfitobacter aestuarii]|uniref:GNAT family N-acetyltransferase n=1 Tax=Sulfitobacter aestuarii TaxID=2161676 RepID=A0ABW5U4E2_9RHOB